LASHEPLIPDTSAMVSAAGISRDPLVSEVPVEGQFAKACRDSGKAPVSVIVARTL